MEFVITGIAAVAGVMISHIVTESEKKQKSEIKKGSENLKTRRVK